MRRHMGGGQAVKVLEVPGKKGDAFRCRCNPKASSFCVLRRDRSTEKDTNWARQGHHFWGIVCGPDIKKPSDGPLSTTTWLRGACGAGANLAPTAVLNI